MARDTGHTPTKLIPPAVATKSVFITGIMDAVEHRCVVIVDMPGGFMQTYHNDGTAIHID